MEKKIYTIKLLTIIVIIIALGTPISIFISLHSLLFEDEVFFAKGEIDLSKVEIITTAISSGSMLYLINGDQKLSTKSVSKYEKESNFFVRVNGSTIVSKKLCYYIDMESKRWFIESEFLEPEITLRYRHHVKNTLRRCIQF